MSYQLKATGVLLNYLVGWVVTKEKQGKANLAWKA